MQHERKLLAAETSCQVELANGLLQDARDGADDLVAGLMAEAVVDRLEVVDVGDHERDARTRQVCTCELALESFVQAPAIREAGQRIGLCLAAQPCDVADHAGDRPCKPRREDGCNRERERRRQEDEPPVTL